MVKDFLGDDGEMGGAGDDIALPEQLSSASLQSQSSRSDLDDLDGVSPQEIQERVDRTMRRQHALDMRRVEKETDDEVIGFQKESKDRRAQLLKAVAATTPDLSARLFEKMESLAYEGHDFTPQEKTELLRAQHASLKDSQDFFDLTVAQRDDLLDRVGFYRGIIVDHSLSGSIDVSFREVLRRPDFGTVAGEQGGPVSAATVLYRKPVFSGYFENYFTFSEAVHQAQKSGVTNLSFSLSVAGGAMTTVGVGVAAAYAKQEHANSGMVGKRSYTTANFFLPRIELSFDEFRPCASHSFLEKCQSAMEKDTESDQFEALKKVLNYYGHFVSTRTLVGGRLFATQTKQFDGKEDSSSLTERFAAKVQASLSAPTVNVELSASAEKSTQADDKSKSSNESQSSTFHAVGGEGVVVQDAAQWAESLYDYKRWAAVQRENLIPSIDVLPEALASDCWRMLKKYVETRTKRSLLFDDNAWFLFYGAYGDTVGCLAKDIYFTISNRNNDAVLSLASDAEPEGAAVVWRKLDGLPGRSQLWRMTEEGHILSLVTRQSGAWGPNREVHFAVTPEKLTDSTGDTYSLVAHQLGRADHQVWEYAGSGEISNLGVGKSHALLVGSNNKVTLSQRADKTRNDRLWQLEEVPLYVVDNLRKVSVSGVDLSWFKLRLKDAQLMLSVNGAEGCDSLPSTSQNTIICQPDINGAHQMWQMDAKGRLISAVKAQDGTNFYDLLLSVNLKTKSLVVAPESDGLAQRWSLQTDQLIVSTHSELVGLVIATDQDPNGVMTATPLSMRAESASSKHSWEKLTIGAAPASSSYRQIVACTDRSNEWAKMVDRRELVVAGKITSINFKLTQRGGFWSVNEGYSIQLTADVIREDRGMVTCSHDDPEDGACLEIAAGVPVGVDSQFLYLPDEAVYSIKLDVKPKSRQLCFQYKLKKNSEWTYVADDTVVGRQQLHVSSTCLSRVESANGQGLLGIGLGFDTIGSVLAPKAILRN